MFSSQYKNQSLYEWITFPRTSSISHQSYDTVHFFKSWGYLKKFIYQTFPSSLWQAFDRIIEILNEPNIGFDVKDFDLIQFQIGGEDDKHYNLLRVIFHERSYATRSVIIHMDTMIEQVQLEEKYPKITSLGTDISISVMLVIIYLNYLMMVSNICL